MDNDNVKTRPSSWLGGQNMTEGFIAGIKMQNRFQLLPTKKLNVETVAGLMDMTLGKKGKTIIRFDTGLRTGQKPHINIDPRGYPTTKNPPIQVSAGTIKNAQTLQTVLKSADYLLTAAVVTLDAYRIYSSYQYDNHIHENSKEVTKKLEDSIAELKRAQYKYGSKDQEDITERISCLQKCLVDVKRTEKVYAETITTSCSIAGGWSAAVVGGAGGAWAGAKAGSMVGWIFGPIGITILAPTGAVIGGIGAAIYSSLAGSMAGEKIADKGLSLLDD